MPRLKAIVLTLFLATASVPATLAAQNTYGAVPGSLNFVQGQANIDGRPLDTKSPPNGQPRQLRVGETLATANGSADILLAPGALLRLGEDSTVRMVAADANRTEVQLQAGRANVSVNVVRQDHLLLVDTQNGQTQMLSQGLYTFNAATHTVRVFNGEAYVFPGSDTSSAVKPVTVKESHEIVLGGEPAKPEKFDRDTADGDLLPWVGPTETRAALADSTLQHNGGGDYAGGGYGEAGYYPGAYGFYGGGSYYDGGSPYGWGPYGFYGYPFFGVGFGGGFGYGGYGYGYGYGGGGVYRRGGFGGYPPPNGPGRIGGGVHGGYAGRGFSGRGVNGGFAGAHSTGGGFHGGGGHR